MAHLGDGRLTFVGIFDSYCWVVVGCMLAVADAWAHYAVMGGCARGAGELGG